MSQLQVDIKDKIQHQSRKRTCEYKLLSIEKSLRTVLTVIRHCNDLRLVLLIRIHL